MSDKLGGQNNIFRVCTETDFDGKTVDGTSIKKAYKQSQDLSPYSTQPLAEIYIIIKKGKKFERVVFIMQLLKYSSLRDKLDSYNLQ